MYLLGQACELEHGLMCEYLYAQFSLKRGLDEGLTVAQLDRVQAWETALISVIKQEMLHLALSTNILTAVGAAPHFERPNFPILSRWYPPMVQIALVPFGERALRHFVYLERPEGMALDDAVGFAAAQHAQPLTVGDAGLVGAAPGVADGPAKHLMNCVMRELGPVLTALPVGPSHPGATAGPTFDIARPAIFLLPHQDAAWKIIKERLDALEEACASLGSQAGLGALARLAGKLRSMSGHIGTHSPDSAA